MAMLGISDVVYGSSGMQGTSTGASDGPPPTPTSQDPQKYVTMFPRHKSNSGSLLRANLKY